MSEDDFPLQGNVEDIMERLQMANDAVGPQVARLVALAHRLVSSKAQHFY
jgi:hypothetical protein